MENELFSYIASIASIAGLAIGIVAYFQQRINQGTGLSNIYNRYLAIADDLDSETRCRLDSIFMPPQTQTPLWKKLLLASLAFAAIVTATVGVLSLGDAQFNKVAYIAYLIVIAVIGLTEIVFAYKTR